MTATEPETITPRAKRHTVVPPPPAVPDAFVVWDITAIAGWLRITERQATETVIVQPGFPAPTTPAGTGNQHRRWRRAEVLAFYFPNAA